MAEALGNYRNSQVSMVDEILSASIDSISVIDATFRFQYMNKTGAKILGCSHSDPIGKTWRQLGLKADIMEPVESNLRWVFLSGETVEDTIETILQEKARHYEYVIVPIKDHMGQFGIALLAIRDVTKTKVLKPTHLGKPTISNNYLASNANNNKSNNALSQMLSAVFEHTNAGIAYLDTDYNIIMVNNEFVKGSGRRHQDVIGRNYFDLFPVSEDKKLFDDVLSSGEPVKQTAKSSIQGNYFGHATSFWDWTIAPVKAGTEGDPVVIGLALSMIDVTQTVITKKFGDVLNDISVSLSTTYDVDRIVQLATTKAAKALDCDFAGAVLKKNNRWMKKVIYGRNKKANEIMNYETNMTASSMVLKENGSHMDISIPLRLRHETIGRMDFVSCVNGAGSYQVFADFITKLGNAVSLALENFKLYEAKRKIADTLQEALLIMPDKIDDLEFAHLYHSASEAARVGGDFYDLFEIKSNKVGIIIGDVSGKGLEAAALTAIVRNTVRAYAMEGYSPSLVMQKTNDVIKAMSDTSSFVTTFFAVLDIETGKLVYCNAGHSTAAIKRLSGVELLRANSPIIGAFSDMKYDDCESVMSDGDLMIMYTDGVIEARIGNEFYGEEKLMSFLDEIQEASVDKLPNLIFQEVTRFTEGVLSDDIALLALSLKRSA